MESLMKSDKISSMEQNIMMQRLDQVRASFLQEFGFEGKFKLEQHSTSGSTHSKNRWHAGRTSWRICADDARTTAALKRQPGWLERFMK